MTEARKQKRPKHADVRVEKVERYIYEMTCPHCKVTHRGAIFDKWVLSMCCPSCGNPVILNFSPAVLALREKELKEIRRGIY